MTALPCTEVCSCAALADPCLVCACRGRDDVVARRHAAPLDAREGRMSAVPGSPWPRLAAWTAVLAVVVLAGCAADPLVRSQQVANGDPQIGRELLVDHGCVACHNVPGIRGQQPAWVGPPLDHWGRRSYIAGALTNNERNLIRWITDPQGVEPGTAMPDLGVSEQEATNIAAYLLSLE